MKSFDVVAVSAVTVTVIVPNPTMKFFIVIDAPDERLTVPCSSPMPIKIVSVSVMLQRKFSVGASPIFLMTAVTPNPPDIESITIIGVGFAKYAA
ncbi:Uncharacterised protein [uncultured archaeon]|nr:Uncharacterised protein [uncultured archaeon]